MSYATAPARVEGLTVELSSERERCARAVGELRRTEVSLKEALTAYERMRGACTELETRLAALEGLGRGGGGSAVVVGGSGMNAVGARRVADANTSGARRTLGDTSSLAIKRIPFIPAMRKAAAGNQRTTSQGTVGGLRARMDDDISSAARSHALEARLQDLEATVAANSVLSPLLTNVPGYVASLDPEIKSKLIAALVASSPTRVGQLFPPSLPLSLSPPTLPGEWPTTLPTSRGSPRQQTSTSSLLHTDALISIQKTSPSISTNLIVPLTQSPAPMPPSPVYGALHYGQPSSPSPPPAVVVVNSSSPTYIPSPPIHPAQTQMYTSTVTHENTNNNNDAPIILPISSSLFDTPTSATSLPISSILLPTQTVNNNVIPPVPTRVIVDPLLGDDDDDDNEGYFPSSTKSRQGGLVPKTTTATTSTNRMMRRPPPQCDTSSTIPVSQQVTGGFGGGRGMGGGGGGGGQWGAPSRLLDDDLPEEKAW